MLTTIDALSLQVRRLQIQDNAFRQQTIQELVTRYPQVHTRQELSQLLLPMDVMNPTCQAVRKRDGKPCSLKAISQNQPYCYHHLPEDAQVGRCSYKFSRESGGIKSVGEWWPEEAIVAVNTVRRGGGWPRAR